MARPRIRPRRDKKDLRQGELGQQSNEFAHVRHRTKTMISNSKTLLGILFLIAGIFSIPLVAQGLSKPVVLPQITGAFGQSVDEDLGLYDVNRFYVLQVEFDESDSLIKLSIYPKHYFEESHPNWTDTGENKYLVWDQYKELLKKLTRIAPLGKLIEPAPSISVVTNMTAWRTAKYENGLLTLGVLTDVAREESDKTELKWFRIEYGKAALDEYDARKARALQPIPDIKFSKPVRSFDIKASND